ncbi:hypothetical protein C6A85_75890, partial [Mycobacterium sp. ITM-2017-0098]
RASGTSTASLAWNDLDPVSRDANRELVQHMLRIVEEIADHTWNTWNGPAPEPVTIPPDADPLHQLALMGFDRDSSIRMARAEHERQRAYYEKHHRRHGEPKVPDLTHEWAQVEADPVLLERALDTVAVTLRSLRE